jgi:hypothetical protein
LTNIHFLLYRLIFHHSSQNQTQPTSIKIPILKWNHFAWTYSKKNQQSYLYMDGARQQSFNFGIIKFDFQSKYAQMINRHKLSLFEFLLDVSSLILFGQSFNGLITRLEIWNEIRSEQQLLVSYRDCRKQNGDLFSWSKISDQTLLDTTKLKSSAFCSGKKNFFFHH